MCAELILIVYFVLYQINTKKNIVGEKKHTDLNQIPLWNCGLLWQHFRDVWKSNQIFNSKRENQETERRRNTQSMFVVLSEHLWKRGSCSDRYNFSKTVCMGVSVNAICVWTHIGVQWSEPDRKRNECLFFFYIYFFCLMFSWVLLAFKVV